MLEHGLVHELRLAILTSQLQVAVQPKVDISTLRVIGGEVLLRWHHPKFGFISAERWITIAESHGLMPQLNRWLVSQAISLIKKGTTLSPLSINISPTSLDNQFVHFLIQELKHYQVDPSLIELEITESTNVENLSMISHCLRVLRKNGVMISLDDFGSGYSSMRYLVELEVDKLKIDKSFIHKAETNKNAYLVLKKMIDLGKEINLKILCEGIETIPQLDLVKTLGADEGQGYYFGKPELIKDQLKLALNSQNSLLIAV
ncbi:EAL domain-containing protein [Candidatus Paracaedibacter symbiosus]|uniref:EAL domain-containing protein n=1 Tax=Candidatus Paracaedibacter symbiosus TaxID=244582 RepID=UPI000509697C|nr:EAL domain-containing protein [Candidatus Paracaedibacter symbiosus]